MMVKQILAIIGGMIVLVIGINLALIVITTASTTGASALMGSFAGAKSFNDLTPLIFYIGLIIGGLGAMLTGAAGFVGKGPLK